VKRKYDGLQCVAKIIKSSNDWIDPEDKANIEREMKVLKKLNHPFHIEFIDYFDYQN